MPRRLGRLLITSRLSTSTLHREPLTPLPVTQAMILVEDSYFNEPNVKHMRSRKRAPR